MEFDSSENNKENSESLFCFVDGCFTTSARNKNLGFHQFPPNDEKRILRKYKNGTQKLVNTRQLWIEALNIEREGTTVIGKMRVCSLHFSRNDYNIKDVKKPFAYLKRTAIPRRNLPLRKNSKLTTKLQVRGFNRLKWRGRLAFQDLDIRVPVSRNRPMKKTEQKESTKETSQNIGGGEEEEAEKREEEEEECMQVEGFTLASLEDGMDKTIIGLDDDESAGTDKEQQITSEFIIKEEPLSDNEQEMEDWSEENNTGSLERNGNYNEGETDWTAPTTVDDKVTKRQITTQSVLEDLESSGDEVDLERRDKKKKMEAEEEEKELEEETSVRDRPCKSCGKRDCRGHDVGLSPTAFVCVVCSELFHTSAQLDAHSEKHDEELNMYGNSWHDDFVYRNSKDLECKICGKHFATKTVLKEHVSRHVGDKLHVCLLCGRQFRHKIESDSDDSFMDDSDADPLYSPTKSELSREQSDIEADNVRASSPLTPEQLRIAEAVDAVLTEECSETVGDIHLEDGEAAPNFSEWGNLWNLEETADVSRKACSNNVDEHNTEEENQQLQEIHSADGKEVPDFCVPGSVESSCSQEEAVNVLDQQENSQLLVAQCKKSQKRVWDKKDNCIYCHTLVTNFTRHVTRNHAEELEVGKILSHPKGSKTRRVLFDNLRKRGNFYHNKNCLKEKSGSLIVVQRPRKNNSPSHYIPCKMCLGFFSQDNLYRHMQKCNQKPDEDSSNNARSSGQTRLIVTPEGSDDLKRTIFPIMKHDDITKAVQDDTLICEFGARMRQYHKDHHMKVVISQKTRELGRLKLEMETKIINNKNSSSKGSKPNPASQIPAEIDVINDHEDPLETSLNSNVTKSRVNSKAQTHVKKRRPKAPSVRTPWSIEEKHALVKHFKKYIMKKKVPNKEECMNCINEETCLAKRSWYHVKFQVKNMFKK